jgi:hypothetical protein
LLWTQRFCYKLLFFYCHGDDVRTSTEAQNPLTPWRIEKLNPSVQLCSLVILFYFKRGETFYGSITAQASGMSNQVLYYGGLGWC